MATTDRGYPIFPTSSPPAGPVQMQQLAEAIDADIETLFNAPGLPVTFGPNWTARPPATDYHQGVTYRNGRMIHGKGLVQCTATPTTSANFLVFTVDPAHLPARTEHLAVSVQTGSAVIRVSHTTGKGELAIASGLVAGQWMDIGSLAWLMK